MTSRLTPLFPWSAVMAAVLLAGCGGGGSDSAGPDAAGAAANEPNATAAAAPQRRAQAVGYANNTGPTASDTNGAAGVAWYPQYGRFKAGDADGDELGVTEIREDGKLVLPVDGVYRLKNALVSIKGIDYVVTPLNAGDIKFDFSVSDGFVSSTATYRQRAVLADPLVVYQWALRNTGQTAFALTDGLYKYMIKREIAKGATAAAAKKLADDRFAFWRKTLVPGEDINAVGAYHQGAFGQGMTAVVVDTGLEIAHEDLQPNVLPGRSLNFADGVVKSNDPTQVEPFFDHGTSVAGLIAAVRGNGKGGQGVAPATKLIGMNLLASSGELSLAYSHGMSGSGVQTQENIAVFNRSYGGSAPYAEVYSEVQEGLHRFTAEKLRRGLGAVNIKSAGNSFIAGDDLAGNFCTVGGAEALGLTCLNTNMEGSQGSPFYFSIGALNSDGVRSFYSQAGASLMASAPAGEFGDLSPAMVTTDVMGCDRGAASFGDAQAADEELGAGFSAAVYPFNTPGNPLNANCNYMSSFNGTSAAGPVASGVVALILSANPALSYRDVRHILALTSTKVDPSNKPVTLKLPDGSFTAHPGWVRNKAGFNHNNWYGFGRVDAGKAVALAQNYWPNLGKARETAWIGQGLYGASKQALKAKVPDNSVKGAEVQVRVDDDMVLEAIQFRFTVTNKETVYVAPPSTTDNTIPEPTDYYSTAGADLAIEVTSPSGTRSVLLGSRQALLLPASNNTELFQGYILKDSVMTSNAFYGESAKGVWKIKVMDLGGADIANTGGMLNPKGLRNNKALTQVEGVAVRVFGH